MGQKQLYMCGWECLHRQYFCLGNLLLPDPAVFSPAVLWYCFLPPLVSCKLLEVWVIKDLFSSSKQCFQGIVKSADFMWGYICFFLLTIACHLIIVQFLSKSKWFGVGHGRNIWHLTRAQCTSKYELFWSIGIVIQILSFRGGEKGKWLEGCCIQINYLTVDLKLNSSV